MSGRLVPFAAGLLLFALLPFLGGSASGPPATSVVLAAGSPAAVQDAVDAVGQARDELAGLDSPSAAAPPGSAFSSAIGGGLFLFPGVSLAPLTADAIAAPLSGVPFFIHPVPGGETSPFGPRIHPLLGRPMFHTGIDLAAACGTPILAAADGTVIYARVSDSWGGRTIIQHTPTVKTAYGHQSKFLVTEGQHVKQGQVIGLSGTTGWSTGCHLHFDVIVNDRYVDPAPYLGFPPSNSASVPYAAVPQLVFDPGTRVISTVQDGDVPISEASVAPLPPGTAPPLPAALTSSSASPTTARPGTTTPKTLAASGATTTTGAPSPRPSTTPSTPTPPATTPATTPSSPTSTTPPPPTSTTPPPTTSTAPAPTSTTPPPATSTPPATQPSSSTTAVATPGSTGATCPSSTTSPTSTTTSTAPTCPTPAAGG